MTLREVIEQYRDTVSPTKRSGLKEVIRLNAMLNGDALPLDKPILKVDSTDMASYRDARLRQVSSGSVLREFSTLSAIFEDARMERKLVASNPCRDIRKPREPDHREVVITRAQIKAMLLEMGYSPMTDVRSVAQAVAVVFLVALRTGMRAGELCGLTWDRVHTGYCSTPHKAGRTAVSLRDVPLTAKSMRLIDKMRGYDPKLVFGMKSSSLDANFRKYRDRARLAGFTFHDSRHTAATWIAARMKSNDVPAQQALLDLCKIFGWKKLDQALTYYNPKASDIARRIG